MAIKKFTVMASNAGEGKYISAATFADTLKTAKKKYNEKFKKGPYACAEVNDLGYIYYKTDDGRVFVPNVERTYDFALSQVKKFNAEETDIKSACAAIKAECGKKSVKASDSESKFRIDIFKKNNPDALVKREYKMFDSEKEAKKYGESIANGDIVNVIEVQASCTKKSVKSSKYLTVPKSKRKSVKASKNAKKFTVKASWRSVEDELKSAKKSYNADFSEGPYACAEVDGRGYMYCDFSYFEKINDTRARVAWTNTYDTFAKAEKTAKQWNAEYRADREGTIAMSAKTPKKFGVKASATAKRIAKSRITASMPDLEDIVMYFNGKKIYEGDGSGLTSAVEKLCEDDSIKDKFVEWCNQFGDPVAFESGDAQDTAFAFAWLIDTFRYEDLDKFYADGDGILNFEVFNKSDEITGAKSIKCTQGDFTYDFSEDEFPFRVTSYYDHSQRGIADGASFDDMDEAVAYAHEKLSEGPVRIEHYDVGAVDINPDKYWENFDGEFWCTPELAEWRDDVWKSMGIGASKSIECNDGIAPDDYDSVEDLVPEAYALSGGEDDDMLEYVDDYVATEGCPATVNFVTYNTPNDWSVDVSKYGENVVSDFIWYLEEVAPELSDKFYDYPSYEDDTTRNAFKGTKYEEGGKYATFYGDNALAANDYEFQFYPAQNQWSAPQIEFDTDELKLIGFTDDEIDELMRIYEDYKAAWIENCKYINAHISEFLANLESNINASKNIKADLSLNLNAKPNYTDWILRGYKFDGEDVTTLRIDFQDDVKKAVMDMFSDPDIETVDLYKIPTEQDTTGVFEDEEYFNTITRDDINAGVDITSAIAVGDDSRHDFSNPIYELDGYVKTLADGVVTQIPGITYDVSKETIAFFDDDNNVVFVQPIGGIVPEPDDLESDIDELSAAVQSEMDRAYGRDNWESEEDDPDYASRAIQLSEDIGEVDIDDLEPITGDDVDYGYGYDSNGEAIDESTVEELYRIAEYEILPKSELAKIDECVSIDEDSWDFYMSSPHVTEKFYIHFKLTEKDIDFNKYALPEAAAFPDFNYYTAVLDFDIYTENGEVTSVVLEEVKINRPDGAFDDYDVKRFDKLYNVDAIINYVEALAADTVKDIYNGTTNL